MAHFSLYTMQKKCFYSATPINMNSVTGNFLQRNTSYYGHLSKYISWRKERGNLDRYQMKFGAKWQLSVRTRLR